MVLREYGSSEEFVGRFRLGQLAKLVIERKFEAEEGAETVGFPHGDFSLVVQTLDNSAGKHLLSPEIVEDQLTVVA